MTGGTRWATAMRRALARASDAAAHGDVPIGAVLLGPDGAVLAEAGNERELTGDPTAHAEVLALRRAVAGGPSSTRQWRLEDTTIVVTLEPCAMCAGAIVNARVGRLVYGALDAKAGAVASVFDIVRDPRLNHRVEVTGGVLADQSAEMLRSFFAGHRHQDP
jgi:tRNA(adenine34) deaminase